MTVEELMEALREMPPWALVKVSSNFGEDVDKARLIDGAVELVRYDAEAWERAVLAARQKRGAPRRRRSRANRDREETPERGA